MCFYMCLDMYFYVCFYMYFICRLFIPLLSVSGTLCTLCTPLSYFKYLYTSSPDILKVP